MIIEDMTMPEFVAGLEKTRTVYIPIGSTEEHGPHLPLSTDTLQAVSVGRRLAERRCIFVAPAIPYGVCRSTCCHPGTLSITTQTLKALVRDVVVSLYRHGLRNFILLTGHAGGTHSAALIDAGEELLERFNDLKIAVLTEYQLAAEEGRGLIETEGDSHAGEIETSRMLHSHPHLVRGDAAREFPRFPKGILVRDKRKFWQGGVWGDPGKASAEKGLRIEELVVSALDRFVDHLESWVE
ncbi:creatininase family protein [Syntrophotalea acetylenica]|jgi:creatinine amidohydrolase|uniref:Creatinine amidohydrolase n=1 Tax=Syntrophotalea acetylenica TaxID=29542 RepID=A0A1L3GIS3_SYNAC|nr:creatininase family protein [Syntrophotalea acetylenica]APG25832.1 creatinine amidohydrolase [Syntrophotalea acetylenica]APG43902.1 creatinine amidohydrolase [Syntrophotalea acetylenica]MDY0263284.1 creatininase family protein [Syntrophotalea acetylenica]